MGAIELVNTGHRTRLRARLRVGRAPDGDLILSHPSVSRDHALIAWSGRVWEVRDLGSQNGTFVEGGRISAGGLAEIRAGSLVTFGTSEAVRLVDDAPPQPLATSERGVIEGVDGVLELPGGNDEDSTLVWSDPVGAWWLEDTAGSRTVSDGEIIEMNPHRWALSLPELPLAPTARDTSADRRGPRIELRAGLFDLNERVMLREDKRIPLSPIEAKLLSFLAARPGATVPYRELLSKVWGYHKAVESRTVYVTVNRLRQKIERDPATPEHLLTIPGLGYQFRPAPP